ncbi:MAG TPA: sulfotransferase [Candidatus Sulfotelmatobacter sp.]|nr:sulfotransferase [Candidatus Sulfotelmatobacter sp.]
MITAMSQLPNIETQSTAETVRAVAEAVGAADFPRARAFAESALSRGLIHPAFFNAIALSLERLGRDEEALASWQQARALAPNDPRILNALGLCFQRLHRFHEAVSAFDEALRMEPANAATHQRKGMALGMAGREDESERAHRRAVQLQPRNSESLASLASIAARKGDSPTAERLAARALDADPGNATAHVVLAQREVSRGDYDAAEKRLHRILDGNLSPHGRAVAFGVLGDALDGLGRTEEAFAAYTAANEQQKRNEAWRFQEKPGALTVADVLIANYESADWHESQLPQVRESIGFGATQHVFLLGFLRSGTTVLEQVLETHEAVATLEEHDFLGTFAERWLTSRSGIDELQRIEDEVLTRAREHYWENVCAQGIRFEGKVFVDKNPLNTLKLPLIWKLFPEAKVLFALRDPRDVVLSCFRRQFEVDLIKLELLDLETTARFYDRVMRFGETCWASLPLGVHTHRYEDMVADFEQSVQAVCAFLGIPWQDSMKDFAVTARGQNIRSPSADQVRRGLYTEGVGQWRRYEKQLAPILPILRPWIERFGYPAN